MDVIDRANEIMEFHRVEALKDELNSRYRNLEKPLIIDGVRCCLDCEEPISEKRLRVQPYAVRCTGCQGRKERRG
jgi:phage/conjugal plasmid C-4 type zinc finger TraR family protein